MVNVANALIVFSFIIAGYAAWAAFMGGKTRRVELIKSAERSTITLLVLSSILMAVLVTAFVTRDFSVEYVASYSSSTLPLFYTISAVWAGQAGSLLLWAWLLCLFAAIVVFQNRNKNREMIPYVLGVINFTAFFFFGLLVYSTNPFELLARPAIEGSGLNPMLQNPGMVIHPPLLYLGYVGFTVPFAFAIAALMTNRLGAQWIKTTRRWTLFSWIFLLLGILFGAKWAYVELGWGGYWAWDPVENASLLPLLTATAYLHSVIIQEKRGMLKVWNHVLIILTFLLTIFGTFITRSGLISSVHSFGLSNIGPMFLLFLGFVLIVSVSLVLKRWQQLKSKNQMEALLSRESSFLFNNVILVGMAFSILLGTIFPLLSEMVTGDIITVGPPYFNQVNVPIGLALLALTGLCPLLAWRKSSIQRLQRNVIIPVSIGLLTAISVFVLEIRSFYPVISFAIIGFVLTTLLIEFYRGVAARRKRSRYNIVVALWDLITYNKRRYGGYIVHLGIVMIFVGITGSSALQKEKSFNLAVNESAQIGDYTLHYSGLVDQSTDHAQITAAEIQVEKEGEIIATMFPARQSYKNYDTVTEVDIRQTLKEDLYIILTGWDEQKKVSLKAMVNPLVAWIWIGTIIMLLGTVIAAGPERIKRKIERLHSIKEEKKEEMHV